MTIENPEKITSLEDVLSPEDYQKYLEIKDLASRQFAEAEQSGKKLQIFQHWSEMANRLRKDYPEAQSYALFHVLLFSGARLDEIKHLDFPGDDSIEAFLKKSNL